MNIKNTTDLFFAAYLKVKGFTLVDYTLLSRGKGKFFFDISDEDYKKNKLDFIASDISKIKQSIEELKDLLY